jgi:hypothetical protein
MGGGGQAEWLRPGYAQEDTEPLQTRAAGGARVGCLQAHAIGPKRKMPGGGGRSPRGTE